MSFKIIRPQIKTLLDSVSKIQQVKGYPTLKFTGYPSAYVVPAENDAEYETTSENIRNYNFIIRLFYTTKDVGVETAMLAMEDLVDDVLNAIDQEDLKGADTRTIGIGLPTGYTFINVWASPSAWGEIVEENLVMAEVTVSVRVSIDVT